MLGLPRTVRCAVVVLLVTVTGACQTELMPTPNIYAGGAYELFSDLDPALCSSSVDLLYVTDRAPIRDPGRPLRYGHGRSRSAAFGSCVVEIGQGVSWETLMRESTSPKRSVSLPLHVRSITEMERFPATPWPLVEQDGRLIDDPIVAAENGEIDERFRQEVRRRLALTPVQEVTLFIHGFHNSFDVSAFVLTELWHFRGREGVPVLFSWPAGEPGLLRAYTHDLESSEFSTYHLRQALRLLASIDEVQRIHVVAHSRGTDLASTALRELLMEERSAGRDPLRTLRIANVVLASADVDLDVFFQRFSADRFFHVADHLTFYVSQQDNAIKLSQWLYESRRRLGDVRPRDLDADEVELLRRIGTFDIVDSKVPGGFIGHSYYHSNPAVSSDLILLLRYGARAGSEQRPLEPAIPRYWVLDQKSYPFAKVR